MATFSSKVIVPQTAAVNAGTPGSLYGPKQSHVFAGAGSSPLPAGDWWIIVNADISVQVTDETGTLQTIIAVGGGGLVRSDGASTVLTSTGATTAYFMPPV
jgi:hypothetical protein